MANPPTPARTSKRFPRCTPNGQSSPFLLLALIVLGLTYALLDNSEKAIECYERGLAITETRGESGFRSYLLWVLAIVMWRNGNHPRATRLLGQALTASRRVNDRLNAALCLQTLAWIANDNNDAQRAVVLTAAAEKVGLSVGSPPVLFPNLLVYQDEYERETRRAMSEQTLAAARREGAALSFDTAVTYALGERVSPTSTSAAGRTVTKREREVANLIAEGLTNKEIAARLTISPRTAQGHVEHLLTKLGFTSRAQIAAWVVESRNEVS